MDPGFQSVEVAVTAGGLDAAEAGSWQWTVRDGSEDIVWSGRYLRCGKRSKAGGGSGRIYTRKRPAAAVAPTSV